MRPSWRKLSERLATLVRRPPSRNSAAAAFVSRLDADALRELVHMVFSTRADELDCDACFEQVDRFAEMMLAGKDATQAMPLVRDHLNRCRCCREEFEALLVTLQALAGLAGP